MKPFRWNHGKNESLKIERGISFEVIALAIEADGLLDELRHPNGKHRVRMESIGSVLTFQQNDGTLL